MSGHDSSDQDILSSDSEESFENENDLGNHLQDLFGNSHHQTSLDGASLQEKKPVLADLDEDLGSRALFHEDCEKRHKQPYGAHLQGSFAGYQLGNTTSDGNVVFAGASLLGAEHSTMESLLRPSEEPGAIVEVMEGKEPELLEIERKEQLFREQRARRHRREREERELSEAESWQQQQESITARSQRYPCHHCHNISKACENEEAKACHATYLKCSYCQHEQEIGEDSARCHKCQREMSSYFCSICKHFTSLDKNPYHCEKCGICQIQQDKSFHCEMCNVCLDKRLKGNHQCRPDSGHVESFICLEDAFSGGQLVSPCLHIAGRGFANDAVTQNSMIHKDKSFHCETCNVCLDKRLEGDHKCCPDSDHDECCICLEDALSGCLISPCSHNVHRENANVAVTQSGIEDNNHGSCLCERCTSFREDKGVSLEVPIIYAASSNSSTQSWADIDDSSAQSQTSYADVSLENFSESKSVSWSDCSANSQIPLEADSYAPDEGFVEPKDNLKNRLEDLLHNSCLQTSLDGSNLVEKKSIPADLENPEGAFLLTDKEKRFMQHYGAHLQGHELGNTMSDGVLPGASSPSTSFFEPLPGDFENSRVSVLSNSDHKSTDNLLLALEQHVAEACALVERVLQEKEEQEQFGREIERKEQLIREQRARERREREERELGCTGREGAGVVLTQNGIEHHNHGLCLCKRCTLSGEDEDKEVSPALSTFADSSSSTQSHAATDNNYAQSQTSSTDAALETLSGLKSASMSDSCSANSQIAPEADSIDDEESQHILYVPFPEGIARNFLVRHTQDKDLYERALLEMSLPNDIPSHCTSSSNLGPVPDFEFGSQRANPYFGDDDTNLQGSFESFLSMLSSGQHERQGMDEGSWAGAVRPHEDCPTAVLEAEAGFGDDIFVQSPADGARPQQAFASANSQSRQFWNHTGARPRETQGRRFSVTADWVSPVARAQQSIEDESLLFDGGREGTEEDFEDGITIACLLRHSQDEALCTWALHEHVFMGEEVEQLRRRIEWKEKVIKGKRACKEDEEEKELREMTCNVQVHTAHKVPVQVCFNCNEIIDAQHQESHPCHHHPDICCICQEYLDDFIGCTEVPCGHKFHEECYINMLLNNIETCPLCRRPF